MSDKEFERKVRCQRIAFDLLKREGLIPSDEEFSPKFENLIIEQDLRSFQEEREESDFMQSMGVLGPEVEEASSEAAEFWATFSSRGGS